MDLIDHSLEARTGQVMSYSSQSLESFHRTSERLLYECINSITDLIHRQIERARNNEFLSDVSTNDVARSAYNISPETRSSMRTLSTDAWNIFKSLTSLIKQRALASRSPSSQESPGEAQREQLDAHELQHHLERLLSKVHVLEASQQSGVNVAGSLSQLNDPGFNDYLHRLRDQSQPSINGSNSDEFARKEAEPMCYSTVQEVAEFAGQRDALQNMARVLTELDSLVKDIDEVPRENVYTERDHSYDGSWSEKVLPPKKGRHLLGNIAINAENNGLDWTDDGRMSSTSNDSRGANYSIRSGEGGNWKQWKFSTGEPFSLSSLPRYQHNSDQQPSDADTDIRPSYGVRSPSTLHSNHSYVIEEITPDQQLKKVVDAASRNTDEGYYTGKCRPSTESGPKPRNSETKYGFYDGTTLIYSKSKSKSDIESLSLKSDHDPWKFTKVQLSDKDGSYTSPLREDLSALTQEISDGSARDLSSESSQNGRHSSPNKGVGYISPDESKFSWLESITLNPEMLISENTAHGDPSYSSLKKKLTMDQSSLESCSKEGHDMADLYAYDNACYLDSGSSHYTGSVGGYTEEIIGDVISSKRPLSTYSDEKTVWKDARADSQFEVENYIGATSNQSELQEQHSAVSAGDITVREDSTRATSMKSCSRQSNSQRSYQMESANSSHRESGFSSPASTSGNKEVKNVSNFWTGPISKENSDHSFIGNIPGMDFYNTAVKQINAMITGRQMTPVAESLSKAQRSSSHLIHDVDKDRGLLTNRSGEHSNYASYTVSRNSIIEDDGCLTKYSQSEGDNIRRSAHKISASPSAERYSSRIDLGSPKVSRSREQVYSLDSFDSGASLLKDRKSKRQYVPFGNNSAGSPKNLSRKSSDIGNFFHALEGSRENEIRKSTSKCSKTMTSCSKHSGSVSSCRNLATERTISHIRSQAVEESLSDMLDKALSGTTQVSKVQSQSFTKDTEKKQTPNTLSGTLQAVEGDVSATSGSYPLFYYSRRSASGSQADNRLADDNFERRLLSNDSSYNIRSLPSSNVPWPEESDKVKSQTSVKKELKGADQTSIKPDTYSYTSARTMPSVGTMKDSWSPSSANSFKAIDSAPWGLVPTASKSCPSMTTPPTRKGTICSYCKSQHFSQNSQWKSNLATIIGYLFAFYILFTILCSAIETHKRSYAGCGFLILDDLYRNFELRHIGPVCT